MGKKRYQAPMLNVFGSIGNLRRSLSLLRRFGPMAGPPGSNIISDQSTKQQFTPVDPAIILHRLAEMPITTWNYKADGKQIRHIGPMAQDFSAAFGVGADNKHIHTVDANGVALAAIQALYQMIQERDGQVAELRAELNALKNQRKQ